MFGLFGSPYGVKKLGAQVAQNYEPVPEAKKPDGTKRVIGILGDFLLGLGGQQGVYGPMAYQRRMLDERAQQEAQQAEAERQARRQEFMFEHDYKRNNPEPMRNDTVEDYNFLAERLGKEGADQYLRNMADPMVTVPLGDGNFYSGPRSGLAAALGGGQQMGQPAAQSALPPGYTKRPKGGPASPAPGGFPGQR